MEAGWESSRPASDRVLRAVARKHRCSRISGARSGAAPPSRPARKLYKIITRDTRYSRAPPGFSRGAARLNPAARKSSAELLRQLDDDPFHAASGLQPDASWSTVRGGLINRARRVGLARYGRIST
jgi:hypothetical protein